MFLLILRRTSAGTPHVAGPLAEVTAGAAVGALLLGLVFGGLQLHIGWPSFGWLLLLAHDQPDAGLAADHLVAAPAARRDLVADCCCCSRPPRCCWRSVVLGERPSLIQIAGAVVVLHRRPGG